MSSILPSVYGMFGLFFHYKQTFFPWYIVHFLDITSSIFGGALECHSLARVMRAANKIWITTFLESGGKCSISSLRRVNAGVKAYSIPVISWIRDETSVQKEHITLQLQSMCRMLPIE